MLPVRPGPSLGCPPALDDATQVGPHGEVGEREVRVTADHEREAARRHVGDRDDVDIAELVGNGRLGQHRCAGAGGHEVGDGILALFGALAPNPWQADDAVHAGLAMVAALEDYNRELAAEGLPMLALGVGIHRGAVVAGLVGSRDLMEFTVVGATVNLAARVQSLTRDYDGRVLVTAAVSAALDPRFRLRPLGEVGVKGVREPVPVVAVDGFALP
jgi:class 3 adenylate cyclase